MRSRRPKTRPKTIREPTTTEGDPTLARRFTVSGRVQGVWFRDSTRRQAEALQITGYARNMPDGTVEVLAIGMPDALEVLRRWLAKGPPMAKVREVTESEAEHRALTVFDIG